MKNYLNNNIICIDLTKFSKDDLDRIVERMPELKCIAVSNDESKCLDYKVSKDMGYKCLYIDKVSKVLIAFTKRNEPKNLIFNNDMAIGFTSMESIKFPKGLSPVKVGVTKTVSATASVDLNVDTILEKISKTGIKSITKEEKEFLDNQ